MASLLPEIIYYINFFVVFFAIIYILLANKESESSLAWILIIVVLPLLGILLYALFGLDRKKHKIVAYRPEEVYSQSLKKLLGREKQKMTGDKSGVAILKNINLLLNTDQAAVTINNNAQLYYHGSTLFPQLLEDLQGAKTSIHMEYFIWKSDRIGSQIKDILVTKAREGVDVKLIFDGLGSFGRISLKYKRELKKAGIQYSYFKDLNRFVARMKINYSNHKKIVVIDGKTAYTGGMNVGDEYIDGGKFFDSWRDTHLRLKGLSVSILQSIFLTDWANCGHELPRNDHLFPLQDDKEEGNLPVQIAISGPDSKWNSIELLLFNMINNASSHLYIQSPYFIPNTAMMRAMESAAMSGISVTFMMAGIPDKKIPWWTAFTNFEPLLKAGVRILHYQAGFLHAKTAIMDDTISTVGTCNMDIRSFRLNYEVNTVFYNEKIARELKEQFLIDEQSCREITLEEIQNMGSPARLRNSFCRLFSPLL